jgi:hypothetical protein
MNQVNEIKKASPMESAMYGLSNASSRLGDLVYDLEQRLSTVLTPSTEGTQDPNPAPHSSILTNAIYTEQERLISVNSRLLSIMERLDL